MDRSLTVVSVLVPCAVVMALIPAGSLRADQAAPGHQPLLADERPAAGRTSPTGHVSPSQLQEPDPQADLTDQLPPPEQTAAVEPSSYMKLTGRVWRVKSGFVFVRTPVGTLTLFSDGGLRKVKSGHTITLWTRERNVVVDIHKNGEATPYQRLITGIPVFTSPDQGGVLLWTPEGGLTLAIDDNEDARASAEQGTPVTVQVNRSGEVVGLPQLNVDIQISDGTKQRQGTMMKLAGTVSKVKAGYAFVETPIGALTLGRKTGFRNAKVGQEVTVWLNEHHLVIDVRQKGEPSTAYRFITGKVSYASQDKSAIKLWTPEGEKTISLPRRTQPRPFREGTPITVHFNGSGEVIAVRKAR